MKIEDYLSDDEIELLSTRLVNLNLRRVKHAECPGEFIYLEGWEPDKEQRVTASAHVPSHWQVCKVDYATTVKIAVKQAYEAMKKELFGDREDEHAKETQERFGLVKENKR